MKRILIKEVDRLYSKIHKGKYISEYIIYLMENDVKLKAINVTGETLKLAHVTRLLLSIDTSDLTKEEIIQEVSFEDVIKNQ